MNNNSHCVAHICLSKGWGGLEMYPARVSKYLPEQGWQAVAICLKGGKVAQSFHNVECDVFEVTSQASAFFKIRKLVNWLKNNNVSVLHCHKSSDLRLAAILKKLTNCRVIFTEHMGVTRPKKDLLHRWIYSHVDQVLSISDITLARNIKALPVKPEKIKRLWLGTEFKKPDRSVSDIKQELEIDQQQLIIGLPGRLCPGKGHQVLLDAFKLLQDDDDFKDAKLLIVGGLSAEDGADEAFVKELKNKVDDYQLNEKVVFSGFRNDMPNLLAIMDIVCIPSKNEAFGLTAIEAMAAGKKIVVANSGALPEIIADTGLLASPDSAESFSRAINKIQQEHYYNIANLAQERAKKTFTIHVHVKKISEFYNNTLTSDT
ncbi:glycosyltransferase family 4 protein [Oceanisphaera pacifica]|uniref:Glycosyltransferase family 4 protein n=1 Tax=Oceanisphaera pacifica TaxID=2818389 RepID=A0ABS3NH72_9GAMM|nr:glycosyltransferase family 4 protein [Oceanisphaera pacifica]MBO1519880.1 glycosyltransferase family 4 protein [Oceanisphaera pacifica]